MTYSLTNITKALDKLFKAGFLDEKAILNMKLEDLSKIDNLTSTEVSIIIGFKQAIKNKKIVAFLSNEYKGNGGMNYVK